MAAVDSHLQQVSRLASLRAKKFGAARLGGLIGLLHDLGKYAPAFQDYIAGRGPSPDHATAGAREIQRLAGRPARIGSPLDRGLLHCRPSRRLVQLAR